MVICLFVPSVFLHRKSLPVIHKFALVTLFSCLSLVGSATWAQTTNIPIKVKAPALAGLHYVFDASESICGYLGGGSTKNPLLGQIKAAAAGKNSSIGNRIYLLKQTVKSKPDAKRDVVEAGADLLAQSMNVKGGGTARGVACEPFNGLDSNIELIFSSESPTQDADAVMLITDAQLLAKDRDKFVDELNDFQLRLVQLLPLLVQAVHEPKMFSLQRAVKIVLAMCVNEGNFEVVDLFGELDG